MDLHPASLGSTHAGTHMSYWLQQEGLLAKIAKLLLCTRKSPTLVPRYLGRHVRYEPLNEGVIDVQFRQYHLYFCHAAVLSNIIAKIASV